MNRRQFLIGLSALSAAGIGAQASGLTKLWPDVGWQNPCLTEMPEALKNHRLMQKIWAGLDASQVWDCHAHLTGNGDSQAGVWMNPKMDSILHPYLNTQKSFYMNGSCATQGNVDNSYVARLLALASQMPQGYKTLLFAFDWLHDENGKPNKRQSIFHVSNDYASKIASEHSLYFEWVASIHPYRDDALDALDQAHAQGARAIKWLPQGMAIDPASPKCDMFYRKLNALKMPIISHTGRESAVDSGNHKFGNPLRMRRALDAGVRVALAHCASDGNDEDLDNQNKYIKSFDLFTRLMETRDYQALVFGEISAVTLINHAWVLPHLLARDDWKNRLINGSDYPLPGIFPLINVRQLTHMGLISTDDLPFLNSLKQYHPLMFDFAVKRLISDQGNQFSHQTFETKRFFTLT